MVAKIFIKLFVVLCCIQTALWGFLHQSTVWVSIAVINMVALFMVLFQERKVFAHMGSSRVLFSHDVFAYLAIAVGLVCTHIWQMQGYTFGYELPWLLVILFGGLFYVISVRLFSMYGEGQTSSDKRYHLYTLLLACLFIYLWVMSGTHIRMMEGFATSSSGKNTVLDTMTHNSDSDTPTGLSEDTLVNGLLQDIDLLQDEADIVQEESDIRESDTALTFGNALPMLVNLYDLEPASGAYTFTYVSTNSELYSSFATARAYNMIGTATSPEQPVLCKHFMVLVGLAEGWDVVASDDIFSVYRERAREKGYLGTCNDFNDQATMNNFSVVRIP